MRLAATGSSPCGALRQVRRWCHYPLLHHYPLLRCAPCVLLPADGDAHLRLSGVACVRYAVAWVLAVLLWCDAALLPPCAACVVPPSAQMCHSWTGLALCGVPAAIRASPPAIRLYASHAGARTGRCDAHIAHRRCSSALWLRVPLPCSMHCHHQQWVCFPAHSAMRVPRPSLRARAVPARLRPRQHM